MTLLPRKSRIRDAFGSAARDYEGSAVVQGIVAQAVAKLAVQRERALPPAPRILEIGCGSGLLTRAIRAQWPDADLVVTDLAPAMVDRAAADPHLAALFLAMDGEQPCFEGQWFDLILSSLAFQWFDDLPCALDRLFALLRPGGSLIFSTMAERSFAEWRAAHAACGAVAGTPGYPSLEEVRAMIAAYPDAFAFDEDYAQAFGGARAFAAHLKGIGATVPVEGRAPLTPRALRHVMRAFDEGGAVATYHVAFARVTRVWEGGAPQPINVHP